MPRKYFLWFGLAIALITAGFKYWLASWILLHFQMSCYTDVHFPGDPVEACTIPAWHLAFDHTYGYWVIFLAGCIAAYGSSKTSLRPLYLVLIGLLSSIAGIYLTVLPWTDAMWSYHPGPDDMNVQISYMVGLFLLPVGAYVFTKGISRLFPALALVAVGVLLLLPSLSSLAGHAIIPLSFGNFQMLAIFDVAAASSVLLGIAMIFGGLVAMRQQIKQGRVM